MLTIFTLSGFLFMVIIGPPASALPPFTQKRDIDRLYISEHYRDGGDQRQYGCAVGGFTDSRDNARIVWNFFIERGYEPHVVAAIIGNMQAESGVMPQRLQKFTFYASQEDLNNNNPYFTSTSEPVPAEAVASAISEIVAQSRRDFRSNVRNLEANKVGWGLVQWTPASKYISTESPVTNANLPQNQALFLWKQLEGQGPSPEGAAGTAVKNAATLEEATRLFAQLYERPSAENLAKSMNDRIRAAEGALASFGNGEQQDAGADGTTTETEGGDPSTTSSCSAATANTGSAAAVAQEQLITGGANFKRDVPGGNAADFVSWAFRQAGTPFSAGEGGWRISSVSGMIDFFKNTPGYTYFDAGTQAPQAGDVAFYVDQQSGTQYTDIVVSVNGSQMTVVGLNSRGDVVQSIKSTEPGANGLIGFGRPPAGQSSGGGSVAPRGPVSPNYDAHLAMIRGVTAYRNTNQDSSPYANTPSASLPVDQLLGPRSEYLGNPAGNPEQDFPTPEGGQNRTGCEFSHFAYDDPLIYPGEPGKAHLHMFFGNTDVNAYTTYDTLINTGSSTCNGMELNRTGYWAPAMFDSNGNVRIPERIVVYYKGEGLARGKSQVYPENAAMIANLTGDVNTINNGQGGAAGKFTFVCSDQFSGASEPASNTMVNCPGTRYAGVRQVLEMNVKFPMCWTGSSPEDFRNSWRIPVEGGWYFSLCNGTHPLTFPNLEYFINYPIEPGEDTSGWYLSSDVNKDSLIKDKTSGSSTHGDWWGGWHKDINKQWIDNCVNYRDPGGAPSGCGFGYLTNGGSDGNNPLPGPALKYRKQYNGPFKVPAQQVFNDLCKSGRTYSGPASAAYCTPNAPPPPPAPPAGTGSGGNSTGGGSTATTNCGGSPQVNVAPPGDNLPSLVSGAADGTCFNLQNGTYSFGNIRPKNNMKFIGASKTGVIVVGGNNENAFSGNASNVVISNMTFRNFNNTAGQSKQEQAPIRGTTGIWQTGPGNLATGWLIDNVISHDNVASGVFVGNDFTVRNSSFYNNGVTGIGGTRFTGGLFENNDVNNNGRDQATGAEQNGGNIKVTFVNGANRNLVIRGNRVAGSTVGIWCDINCDGVLIEGNTIGTHGTTGIFSEISRNITIRNNTLTNSSSWVNWTGDWNNGSIGVGESGNILIEGNTINGGASAITVRQTRRPAAGESFLLSVSLVNTTSNNVTIRNNRINGSGSIGAGHGPTGAGLLQYNTIVFSGNTYSQPNTAASCSESNGTQFWWNGSCLNYSQWRSAGRQ